MQPNNPLDKRDLMSDAGESKAMESGSVQEGSSEAGSSSFRWVAEWVRHDATWISWPHNLATWPNRFEKIPEIFERKIRTLAEVEHVHVLGGPPSAFEVASKMLRGCENVTLHRITTNDVWVRDFGPTFVLSQDGSRIAGVDWRFNAWGGKYPHEHDSAVAIRICNALNCERISSKLTCEGGGLETDGEGTLLATSSSIVTASRNPCWTRDAIERELKSMLQLEKILWIDGGELSGDDTDSHIDQLVRFIRPGLVVAAVASTEDDADSAALQRQLRCLSQVQDARGRSLDIVKLPTPPPRFIETKPVPESYCNFYIANEIVLVPQFGYRATDDQAMSILGDLFFDRQLVPLDASNLIWGLGAFHCATQQQPAVS